ncbi:zinc-ribbon domain-containing protein [Cribrihabitans pelagius]|uniref:zinc-ribbon domain-containing protein n=1 Tax=Cribrihabitans pelagius TaxID=1765746 RepID=UPI003B58DE81
MRLTCPNCAAQYEVPDDVIPAEGRDVQCSECDQTWFQPGAAEEAEAGPGQPGSPLPEHAEPEQEERAAPAPETALPDSAAGNSAGPAIEPPAPRPRGLDPDLSDILREEAAREAALRAAEAEAEALETQPDLGLDAMPGEPPARPRRPDRSEHPERIARSPRGDRPADAAQDRTWQRNGLETEAAASGSRRDLLPDIEEINSTLRAGESAAAAGAAEAGGRRRSQGGFARGFTLSLLVMLALVMVYANAPVIAERLPQAGSALESYVAWVDQLRLWLDVQVKSLTAA